MNSKTLEKQKLTKSVIAKPLVNSLVKPLANPLIKPLAKPLAKSFAKPPAKLIVKSLRNKSNKQNALKSIPQSHNFEVVSHVYRTKDYNAFKYFEGNRNIIPKHLAELIASFEEQQLIVPIIVNEKMEIIDGQHRYRASVEKKMYVHFIICEGYGIKQIQMINSNMKNWSVEDFVEFYCGKGMENYIIYRDFKIKFGLGHQETIALLLNSTANFSKVFLDGNLVIKEEDYKQAELFASRIMEFGLYYKGYKRKSFVFAIIHLMKNVKEYSHNEMIRKIKKQSTKLVDCPSLKSYLQLLESIYNYYRIGNQIRFI